MTVDANDLLFFSACGRATARTSSMFTELNVAADAVTVKPAMEAAY